ncbi:AEC family transporter [Nodosilinea sp. P-1105]|uniref:AEC family transporter n=1 Tax=Nodosilinea sp. P-1105 TaxID=2546229 RepID=UPI00146BC6A2|nr:AEC family transporter [Nodosilinea sp. P-1105]NMF85663.1 AEC family transporter [Nodosilinea sp. P-1105]
MSHSLVNVYLPLLFWPGLGLLLSRLLPVDFPRLLGRLLYWLGIPLEIFALAHGTDFSQNTGLAPLFTVVAVVLGLGLGLVTLWGIRWAEQARSTLTGEAGGEQQLVWADNPRQGSFLLGAMIGNTGFVGLAIVPALVSGPYLGWAVFYSVTQNVVGTYGLGVLVASYFGRGLHAQSRWQQVQDVLTVPSLWAFGLGYLSHRWVLPDWVEVPLGGSVWVVIALALMLMGMRFRQIQGWQSLRLAIAPTLIKILVLPAMVGVVALAARLPLDACRVLVLMAGMPSAFGGLILAEEYDLDRELASSNIALSSLALLVTIPLWLALFEGLALTSGLGA